MTTAEKEKVMKQFTLAMMVVVTTFTAAPVQAKSALQYFLEIIFTPTPTGGCDTKGCCLADGCGVK